MGSLTLVASRRPPMPTSRTATSTAWSRKWTKAAAVTASKNVGCAESVPARTSRRAARRTWSTAASRAAGAISSPPTVILSFTRTRCGDV